MRVVVCLPDGGQGPELPPATAVEALWAAGGHRTLYELAAAIACTGREVELRGRFAAPDLRAVCNAAGTRPRLPLEPRPPEDGDIVFVPEGSPYPSDYVRVATSPARRVLMLLAAPGLFGWPFAAGWSPPDPLTVPISALARTEHFRAAAAAGFDLWAPSRGMVDAAGRAGVPCAWIGNGQPDVFPPPSPERDVDVVALADNRWAPLAREVLDALPPEVSRVVLPGAGRAQVLATLGRARVLVHPARVEGHSRVGCEARAMGAVPVVLDTNPFAAGLDDEGGAVAVSTLEEMPAAVTELLSRPAELEARAHRAMRAARAQVEWAPYVRRVDEQLRRLAGRPVAEVRGSVARELLEAARDGQRRPAGATPALDVPPPRRRVPAPSVGGVRWPPRHDLPDSVGLVRALDRSAGRHRYALGSVPEGELVGELGAAMAGPPDGSVSAWIDAEGRLHTGRYRPGARRPAPATLARWALAPLRWSEVPRETRMRLVTRRAGEAARRAVAPARPSPEPVASSCGGLLGEPGPDRLALWSAVHPVTGDQLLTTNRWEAIDLGYGEPELLGHLLRAAPVTGRLGAGLPVLPWASRLGQAVVDRTEAAGQPRGEIRAAPPTRATPSAVLASGWALAPGVPIESVEVHVDRVPVGCAELGRARAEVAERVGRPEAEVCGFQLLAVRPPAPDTATSVFVGGVVRAGEITFHLPEIALPVLRPALERVPQGAFPVRSA